MKLLGTSLILVSAMTVFAQKQKDTIVSFQTNELIPIEIRSIRASSKSPFTKTSLKKEEIAKLNLGQDLPFILNQTPSVVVNSDAGNGVGYTGISIRGTDASRVNITMNGIAFNDAESQGTFFVNMPDFISSVNSIQIQRGVGTSSNGVGAFGASINMSTNEFLEKAGAEINNSFGSFGTIKNTLKLNSGLLNNHFTIDARLSNITSNGYVDRAKSDLKGFYFSTAYINKKSSVRLNVFSGKEKTYQAWNGIDEQNLKTTRTFNVSGTSKPGEPYDNETDNYSQTHYQLFFNHELNKNWNLNFTNFYTKGNGFYENYRFNERYSNYGLPNVTIGAASITRSDFIRQLWLDNNFYGQLLSSNFKKDKNTFTLGLGWSTYEGQHFGKLTWSKNGGLPLNHSIYNTPALKKDAHLFTKIEHQANKYTTLFADIQYRKVDYFMDGFRNNTSLIIDRQFAFINPKIGVTYAKNGWQSYLSFALANKEPNRNDFEAGNLNQPKHETLHNIEMGVEKRTKIYFVAANVYGMFYKNQLVNNGKINDVGAYTRTNVDNSYRMGVELQASYQFAKKLNFTANLTLSKNKIVSYSEFIDNYDLNIQVSKEYKNTNISLSPNIVANFSINYNPISEVELSLLSKYVGKQYLDNTQNEARTLKAFHTQDVRVIYTPKIKNFKAINLIMQVNNLLNLMYEPNGYTFSYIAGGADITENFYFPMAGTNFMFGVNVKL